MDESEDSTDESEEDLPICNKCWGYIQDGYYCCLNSDCENDGVEDEYEYLPTRKEIARDYYTAEKHALEEEDGSALSALNEDIDARHIAEQVIEGEMEKHKYLIRCTEKTQLSLVTFNLWRLGSNADKERDFDAIVAEIKQGNIIAIQEVHDPGGGESLIDRMPREFEWRCTTESTKRTSEARQADHFGFLFDTKLWQCDMIESISDQLIGNPKFAYVPCHGRFSSKISKRTTINIISVHLTPGRTKKETRKRELETIFRYINENKSPKDPFWVVMGDMNIENQKEGEELDELNLDALRLNTDAKPTNHPMAKKKHPYDDAIVIGRRNPYGQNFQPNYEDDFQVTKPFTPSAPKWKMSTYKYRSKFSDHFVCTFQFTYSASWTEQPTEDDRDSIARCVKDKLAAIEVEEEEEEVEEED